MKRKYREVQKAGNFTFAPDTYYHIRMSVRLNSTPEKADGQVVVYVDGKKLITHDKIRFRNALSTDSEINTFLFNTFHGGHTKAWAPLENDGSYATECAYFDNFVVN
ncbi:polysaccharide lyase [Azotobacter salinestris]|uniref:polysaccharide lyase n=1 Tax=Azotobacter salinestris TaxID=69964 RepID=UPI0032DF1FB7